MQTIKGYIEEDLKDYETEEDKKSYLQEVVAHGGVSGAINGLIYYDDTTRFYDLMEEEIEDKLEEWKEATGAENRMEAISKLGGADNVGNIAQEKNLLVWFAYERVARELLDEM